ncbi:hypothetical protein ACS0TY_021321 [Phlomoides rotata]
MSTSTIRKAIGAVKDQTSISLAKVARNAAPDLEVLVVKATTHDNEPADDKYAREILSMISSSRGCVNASVFAISKRLSKTRDWIVALKALMLVHKLLNDGGPVFGQKLLLAGRKGARVLNMSDFRDDAHSSSWDHSGFVRTFALYLDQKVEFMVYERKLSVGDLSDERESNEVTLVRDLGPERALERLHQLLRLLDRFLASRPTGAAKSNRMILVALCLLVKESFKVYGDISDVLKYFLDCFPELEYGISAKVFDAYVNATKMIDELNTFYNWCNDIGVVRSSEFPEVHRISVKLLGSLEGLLREKANRHRPKSPAESVDEERFSEIKETSMNEIKALPPPDVPQPAQNQVVTEDLVNLKDEEWIKFPNVGSGSAPAAESGKAGWELVLVESASNLSNQKSDLGGGFDHLLLNGMYDHGTVKQHVNNAQMRGGSASSVASPWFSKTVPVLALPAPDGTLQPMGQHDPFAASLLVPPPAYVQIADMERKQQLVTQEQQLWQQYASAGLQGQLGFAKISGNAAGYYDASMPYGMPRLGYYYTSY